MSLLQQDTSEKDDAARGESFTKGSSHIVWASIAAAVVVTVAIVVYFVTGEKPSAATGEVTQIAVHFRHQQSSGLDANGEAMPKEDFDQVLVFSHVKLHNRSKIPLFLLRIMTNITLDDGVHTSYAASAMEYERLFAAYPELASLHGKPFSLQASVQPGQTLEGDFVSSFRMTRQQWDARKSLNYGVNFRYQPELVLTLPPAVPVTIQ